MRLLFKYRDYIWRIVIQGFNWIVEGYFSQGLSDGFKVIFEGLFLSNFRNWGIFVLLWNCRSFYVEKIKCFKRPLELRFFPILFSKVQKFRNNKITINHWIFKMYFFCGYKSPCYFSRTIRGLQFLKYILKSKGTVEGQ